MSESYREYLDGNKKRLAMGAMLSPLELAELYHIILTTLPVLMRSDKYNMNQNDPIFNHPSKHNVIDKLTKHEKYYILFTPDELEYARIICDHYTVLSDGLCRKVYGLRTHTGD